MLKQTITYTDFNGVEQTDDFYFNLTKAEAVATELSGEGNSFSDHMNRVIKSNKGRDIIKGMQEIIKLSYGRRSIDGARFEKSPEILMEFTSSNAYSELFMKLATDAQFAAEFANGIMPAGLDLEELTRNADGSKVMGEPEETPSQRARRLSEERLQGHQQAQAQRNKDEARGSGIVDVPQVVSAPEQLQVTSEVLTVEEINTMPISEDQKARLRRSIGA